MGPLPVVGVGFFFGFFLDFTIAPSLHGTGVVYFRQRK